MEGHVADVRVKSFKMIFSGVTILQGGVEFPIFLLIFAWALQQRSATALPVILYDMLLQVYIVCGYLLVSIYLFERCFQQ